MALSPSGQKIEPIYGVDAGLVAAHAHGRRLTTPAEVITYRNLGADIINHSIAPEATLARKRFCSSAGFGLFRNLILIKLTIWNVRYGGCQCFPLRILIRTGRVSLIFSPFSSVPSARARRTDHPGRLP